MVRGVGKGVDGVMVEEPRRVGVFRQRLNAATDAGSHPWGGVMSGIRRSVSDPCRRQRCLTRCVSDVRGGDFRSVSGSIRKASRRFTDMRRRRFRSTCRSVGETPHGGADVRCCALCRRQQCRCRTVCVMEHTPCDVCGGAAGGVSSRCKTSSRRHCRL